MFPDNKRRTCHQQTIPDCVTRQNFHRAIVEFTIVFNMINGFAFTDIYHRGVMERMNEGTLS